MNSGEGCNQEAPRHKNHPQQPCGHHYHYHHHYRHRCRFRSNSCERIEISQRDSGTDNAICRSKSNVEICLYHNKNVKKRPDESSTSLEHSSNELETSSNEHFHRNHKRKRDVYRTRSKSSQKISNNESNEKDEEKPTFSRLEKSMY